MLCVGHVCVDLISVCSSYPEEDGKVGTTTKINRCVDQRWQRGGNAANNTTVLGMLAANPAFIGTIADSHEKSFILEDFSKYGVDTSQAVIHAGCSCPASSVVLSLATGSRTIIHANKDLPELTPQDFAKIDLSQCTWIHFEGRNVAGVVAMIEQVRQHNRGRRDPIRISVELEKAKPELHSLAGLADVLFVSKDYATYQGYADMRDTVERIVKEAMPGCLVICPWGEKGACAGDDKSEVVFSQAFPPSQVVDTLGAGDTFIASTIFALSRHNSPAASIEFGCRVAGAKVGVCGWEPLRDLLNGDDFQAIIGDIRAVKEPRSNS